ncbi:MAG: molecular chaperone GrpE, partial [Pseudonocardiales bacterium]|nr:molecular chaperone GrpE [Pseudonocardiales bacterium]
SAGATDVAAALQAALAERTTDLQRVQAEYANYRKRADRDRLAAGDVAISRVLAELLPVLDDIDRARNHDDLTGALKAVADHLEGIFTKLGLEAFGDVGDPFDPAIHEAVMHAESDEVTEPTCTTVMRVGYKHGERLLRPAMVGVSEPPHPAPAPAPDPASHEPADPEQPE